MYILLQMQMKHPPSFLHKPSATNSIKLFVDPRRWLNTTTRHETLYWLSWLFWEIGLIIPVQNVGNILLLTSPSEGNRRRRRLIVAPSILIKFIVLKLFVSRGFLSNLLASLLASTQWLLRTVISTSNTKYRSQFHSTVYNQFVYYTAVNSDAYSKQKIYFYSMNLGNRINILLKKSYTLF